MVKNVELWDLARKIESFVGFTDDILGEPSFVDLFTQVIDLRVDTEKVQGEIGKENENLRAELVVLCRVVATLSSNRVESSKVKIPEQKAFSGARSAKKQDNFIWEMEQYFTTTRVPDSYKLNITTMYLTGDAKLWWRTRNEYDVRDKLKRLRQTGSVREYIKEFTSVMLDIQNMSDEDKLHNFISDSLVDFQTTRPLTDVPSTSKTKKKNKKKGEWKKDNHKDNTNDKAKAQMRDGKDKPKNKDSNSKGCWTCGRPHLAKSCPNWEKVNPFLAGNMNQREEDEEIVAAMANPLGLSFNHITGINNVGEMSSTLNPHASLIHIEMKVKNNV
ncbi:uncharacterized protein [Solanum lycopersicum]|uniref:uncharacterized protein n=1 Tax=Solanum lycopersicum TaxID=4081 RepID=UPI00374A1B5F